MRRSILALTSALLLVGALTVPATGATATFVSGVPLVGPQGVVWCTTGDPFLPGQLDLSYAQGPGAVSFMAGDTMVGGSVVLRGAIPNHTYYVRLIQATPSALDCWHQDATIWTDAWGNGSAVVREARLPQASAMTFIVDETQLGGIPVFRAKSKFPLTPFAVLAPNAGQAGVQAGPVSSLKR
jgi:hypothetical protein